MTKKPRSTTAKPKESRATVQADLAFPTESAFRSAKAGQLDIGELFRIAAQLTEQNQTQEAVRLYRAWLDHTDSPLVYAGWFNLAVLLSNIQDIAGADEAYRKVIALNPAFLQGYLNLGTHLERQGRYDEALEQWHEARRQADVTTEDGLTHAVMALNNLGRLLENRKRFTEAEQMLKESMLLDPKQVDPLTHWVHLRQKQCEWPVYQPFGEITEKQMVDATSALAMLGATNDPALQLAAARRFVEAKIRVNATPLTGKYGYGHKRLRIGYLSGDFCSHAVSILTAELYELHDREKVEVYGFCWSREDGTAMRQRVAGAMDHLVRIGHMSDEEAARCIRSHEIDILVDLQGLTAGTRPVILYYRPAPVQITYLGFPGPTGLPPVDYVLADRFLIPPELQPFFTEKALYMPNCFQINDRKREIGPKPTRAACKLPEDKFVYCSFNNNFKFTPEMFGVWMNILKRVPDSVLWMVSDSEEVRRNLVATAEAAGVDPERLLFAERVQPADYLARFQVADLFLDTLPFNAGTTASDALWAGLPLLTCTGKTFAGRMAGSLLMAADLPELVTFDLQAYEDKAVELGLDPARVEVMKKHLDETRHTSALFDSPRFVRDLEQIYFDIAKPARPGEEPSADEGAALPVEVENVMVVINESDIAAAAELVQDLPHYKTYIFDPGLIDKALNGGLRNVEFINWEDCPGYFDLDKSTNEIVFEMEEALAEVTKDLMPGVSLLSWQHLHMYYMVKGARWYQGLWNKLAYRFEGTKPFVFVNDNPSQFYWPSFIPAVTLLEVLVSRGIEFSGFTAGARSDDMGFVPMLVREPGDDSAPEILTHLPTCFYDAHFFNAEIAAAGKSVVNITSKYWNIPVDVATAIPLHRIGNFEDGLPDELKERIEDATLKLTQRLDELLTPYIRTPDYRQRQAEHNAARFRAQIWTYFMLENYFGTKPPKKMLLSDHDTDFIGPLESYAEKHALDVILLPHSKVSPDMFWSYKNTMSLMHPICGETILDAYGKNVQHFPVAYPETFTHSSKPPAPLKRVGLLLNAMTANNGVLNTHYDLYMDGINKIVSWCADNDIELIIRCKPSYTMTSLLKGETGIDIATLTGWINMTMADFAAQCDVCLMYDAPTSGALEFLNASIPILNPVPEELSKVEARVINPKVVPRTSVDKALVLMDSFIADELNLFYFRANQFQNYVKSYEGARSLRSFI